MKKIVISIILALSLILPFSFSVLATGNYGLALETVSLEVWYPEPPERDNIIYILLTDGNGGTNQNGHFLVISFPLISKQQFDEKEISCYLELSSQNQVFKVIAPSLAGATYYFYRYNLRGTLEYSASKVIDSNGYSSLTFNNPTWHTFWTKGPVDYYITDNTNYNLAHIYWQGDYAYANQLKNILDKLDYIFAAEGAIGTQMQNYHTQLMNAFNAFTSQQYGQLLNIQDALTIIINLLGGTNQATTIPAENEMESNVSDYIDSEGQYVEELQTAFDDVSPIFNEIDNVLNDNTNGFTAIRLIFNNFIEDLTFLYVPLLFSLAFGAVALIIGKVIPRANSLNYVSKKRGK